jgi:hypothetical protein
MKTLKKTAGWLVMAAAITLATTACSSDDNIVEKPVNPTTAKTYTMTVNASMGNDATTRALDYDSGTKTITVKWSQGEHVAVYAKDYMNNYQLAGTLSPATTGSATATLTGTVTLDGKPELTLVYVGSQTPTNSMTFSYTEQTGFYYFIPYGYDYASATVATDNYTISGTEVSTASAVNFTNEQAIVRFILKDESGNELHATSLTVNPAAASFDASGGMAAVPGDLTIENGGNPIGEWVALRGVTNKTLTLTATVGSDTYIYKRNNVTFEHGKFYDITVKMKKLETKELSAVTASEIGWVVGSDGKAYKDKMMLPAGVTARAVIGYYLAAPSKKGYAFALEDAKDLQNHTTFTWAKASEAIMYWSMSHAISGQTWTLLDYSHWVYFLYTNHGNTLINNAGGMAMSGEYWTATENSGDMSQATYIDINDGVMAYYSFKTDSYKARAGIEFATTY